MTKANFNNSYFNGRHPKGRTTRKKSNFQFKVCRYQSGCSVTDLGESIQELEIFVEDGVLDDSDNHLLFGEIPKRMLITHTTKWEWLDTSSSHLWSMQMESSSPLLFHRMSSCQQACLPQLRPKLPKPSNSFQSMAPSRFLSADFTSDCCIILHQIEETEF